MKRVVKFLIAVVTISFFYSQIVNAETLRVRWTPRSTPGLIQSYRVSYGPLGSQYGKVLLTSSTQFQVSDLPVNQALRVSISAILFTGITVQEVADLVVVIPDSSTEITTDSDLDSIPNGLDNCSQVSNYSQMDIDSDGIGDACDEVNLPEPTPTVTPQPTPTPTPVSPTPTPQPTPTVQPLLPGDTSLDSDNDGVSDDLENENGTNPFDRGSKVELLRTEFCGEWNGYITFNYAELRNLSNRNLNVLALLYDGSGIVRGQTYFSVSAGAQYDLAVHSISGFQRNAYGRLCFQHNGNPGEIEGQVSAYHPNLNQTSFQFAYSSSFENGKKGEVVLPLNTFNPNITARNDNFVANWMQVTNLSAERQFGMLYMHAQNGEILNQIRVSLEPGQREDFSAHQFGRMTGLIRWTPDNNSVKFLTRVVRYVYDNKQANFSFDTAAQINGMLGTGEEIYLPLSTKNGVAIIEVLNASSKATSASVEIRNESGELVRIFYLGPNLLPAYGSFHLMLDSVLGSGKIASAIVRGSESESIAASAMMYIRSSSQDLEYMYGIEGTTVAKTNLAGSYNTNIGLTPYATLINTSNSVASVSLELTRSNGQKSGPSNMLTIPANGMIELNLKEYETSDVYGAIKVVSNQKLVGSVVRERGMDFGIPTIMK